MPHRKRCTRCKREMDCIQGEPRRYWCLSCNIEFHSDRPEGDQWVDASGEGLETEPEPTPEKDPDVDQDVSPTGDTSNTDPEPEPGVQGVIF